MYTTQHTTQSRLCVFVGTGFFDFFFSNKTHAAETSRRSMGSGFVVQRRPDTAEICRKTGFYKQFVTHWISKYKDSGSVDDPRAGRPRKLSARVERAVEKKMRGKRRRSSRVIERELKRQKVSDVSYKIEVCTHSNSVKPHDFLKLTSAVG